MSLIIKMDSIKSASHLKRAIAYILKESKTQGLSYSNCGSGADEIYDNFQFTKSMHRNSGIREGYHFKMSFSKDETISPEDALAFAKEWARKYLITQGIPSAEPNVSTESDIHLDVQNSLQSYLNTHPKVQNTQQPDPFDFVVAVHTDRDHTHMHLIFNSVSRDGHKYRYEKGHTIKLPDGTDKHIPGEWERIITPLTNWLADKYHTGPLREKDSSKDYSHPEKWTDIVCKDIDRCISVSSDYEDFKRRIQLDFNYTLREGISRDHGIYLSLTPPGKAKAIRTYRLPEGYSVPDIDIRIRSKAHMKDDDIQSHPTANHQTTNRSPDTWQANIPAEQLTLSPDEEKEYRSCFTSKDSWFNLGSVFIPYDELSFYQKAFVRQMLTARSLYHATNTTKALTEQSQVAYDAIRGRVRLVCHYHIISEKELDDTIQSLINIRSNGNASKNQKSALNELQRIRIHEKIRQVRISHEETYEHSSEHNLGIDSQTRSPHPTTPAHTTER